MDIDLRQSSFNFPFSKTLKQISPYEAFDYDRKSIEHYFGCCENALSVYVSEEKAGNLSINYQNDFNQMKTKYDLVETVIHIIKSIEKSFNDRLWINRFKINEKIKLILDTTNKCIDLSSASWHFKTVYEMKEFVNQVLKSVLNGFNNNAQYSGPRTMVTAEFEEFVKKYYFIEKLE